MWMNGNVASILLITPPPSSSTLVVLLAPPCFLFYFRRGVSYHSYTYPPSLSLAPLPPAVARQSDWDGVVALHRGRLAASTWNYHRCTMGAHHLKPPDVRKNAVATVTV